MFLDYNQNAKDRTIASAYSVRPTPDARVSAPLTWDEIDDCNPADFTLTTMPGALRAGRRSSRRHRRASVLARTPARAVGATERDGQGDRAVAAALQEADRRAVQGARRRRTSAIR